VVSICDTVVTVVPLEMEEVSESARLRSVDVVTEKEAELLVWEPPLKQVVQGQTGVFVRGGGGAQWRANQFRAAEGMLKRFVVELMLVVVVMVLFLVMLVVEM
jgi:hypothetical protein